ncbi:hypothetical protein GQ43DRAFT_36966 [Delitschia confertaspora ATCC 74209]|uniref:Uncharacterized protein n=1 Tax=Delitschia confertaspora ATCC 74209 TaxID=1513339 RepID=A0A9P4MVT3_9PLEO|nr:hypothetical protein GQ43DRAFT_36966 [Delitschia confertaspora ATCC 74209]
MCIPFSMVLASVARSSYQGVYIFGTIISGVPSQYILIWTFLIGQGTGLPPCHQFPPIRSTFLGRRKTPSCRKQRISASFLSCAPPRHHHSPGFPRSPDSYNFCPARSSASWNRDASNSGDSSDLLPLNFLQNSRVVVH